MCHGADWSPQSPALRLERLPQCSWAPHLTCVMEAAGRAGHEESLLEELLADIRAGHP